METRIVGMIESGLRRGLTIGLRLLENLQGGAADLSRGDVARFAVWARNDTDLVLQRVAGFVEPTVSTDFPSTQFEIRDLQTGEQRDIAEILVRVVAPPPSRAEYGWIAKAAFVASPAIPPVELREPERVLSYAPEREVAPSADRRSSIPLSED